MPQLLFLGIDPSCASADAAHATAFLEPSAPLLASNPRHPVIRQMCGERVREANSAKFESLLESREDLAYVTVGHPLLDDGCARELHHQATMAGWDVRVVAAPSLLEQAYANLPLKGAPHMVVSGTETISGTGDAGLLVLAANVLPHQLQALKKHYPAAHEVDVLIPATSTAPGPYRLSLSEAIGQDPDVLYIPH